ncbi:MAG: glycosyltransferase family 2 protein [bacterium]|nr:glycosyltransferase family 2 protein [bacterium]
MKVSIIIPVYNEEKTIGECLESLSGQTYIDIEIIVVDDGSTDTTSLKLRSAVKTFGIKVFTQDHLGPGAARNLGAKKAKGEILVFVDADMTFDSRFIEMLVKPIIDPTSPPLRPHFAKASRGFAGLRGVKGTFSKDEYVSNWDNVWARCWNINQGWMDKRRHPRRYPNKQKVFRAILKSEFERVGGFDPKRGYTDDWSLSEKLGYKAQAVEGAVFYHQNPDNLREVFLQAKWAAKRPYKLGKIGAIFALLRSSLPESIWMGTVKMLVKKEPFFILFKIAYDFGTFIGIIEYLLSGSVTK